MKKKTKQRKRKRKTNYGNRNDGMKIAKELIQTKQSTNLVRHVSVSVSVCVWCSKGCAGYSQLICTYYAFGSGLVTCAIHWVLLSVCCVLSEMAANNNCVNDDNIILENYR